MKSKGEPAPLPPPQQQLQVDVVDRRRLFNVRVIQRNLVYVVGLTMNNCREEVKFSAGRKLVCE